MGRAGVVVVGLFVVVVAGLFVVWVAQGRADMGRAYCQNNLRQLGQFAALHAQPPQGAKPGEIPHAVPAGTLANPDFQSDRRLSWVIDALPAFNQKTQPTTTLAAEFDRSLPWDAEKNRGPVRTRLVGLTCFGNPPEPVDPAVTQYVGSAGVNPAAATLLPTDPRAGAFRYDGPTPFAAFADGLSNTVLFAETNANLGPWSAGGPPTVRGFDAGLGDPRPIGVGGQFGGNHPGGGNFGFADGSARFVTDRVGPDLFRGLVTIAGGAADPVPGE